MSQGKWGFGGFLTRLSEGAVESCEQQELVYSNQTHPRRLFIQSPGKDNLSWGWETRSALPGLAFPEGEGPGHACLMR